MTSSSSRTERHRNGLLYTSIVSTAPPQRKILSIQNKKTDEQGRIYVSESILKWNSTFEQELQSSAEGQPGDELWWIILISKQDEIKPLPTINEQITLTPGNQIYTVIQTGCGFPNKSHRTRKTSYVLLRKDDIES